MWLLAAALVKIITYRSKMLEHQTQLNTMKEIIRTLQHEINNPLAIIMGFLNQAEKEAQNLPEILNDLKEIKIGAYRIKKTLVDFSNANDYRTVDSPVGQMAQPKRTDEAS
jgi:signal transduction histidine kinase